MEDEPSHVPEMLDPLESPAGAPVLAQPVQKRIGV